MMQHLSLLAMGLIVALISIPGLRGDPSAFLRYTRRSVSEDNAPKYGRLMALGTLILGLSFTLTALLQLLLDRDELYSLALAGVLAGLCVMLYAHVRYTTRK